MPKPQGRKPPRRKRAITLDPELIQIAELLDEQRLEKNAKGWLALPWRDGRCAAMLASYTGHRVERNTPQGIATGTTISRRLAASYWELDDTLQSLLPISRFDRAGLRCLQVRAANSDGGGHIYNEILERISENLHEDDVIEWRCRDALGHGTTPTAMADFRARHVFKLAWQRGLFHAAYALRGPATVWGAAP